MPVQTDQLTSVLNQTPVHMSGLMSGGDLALELWSRNVWSDIPSCLSPFLLADHPGVFAAAATSGLYLGIPRVLVVRFQALGGGGGF